MVICGTSNRVSIFEPFKGRTFEAAELIPDVLVSLILEYYAYECQERYRSQQAKQVCRVFRSIGFRTWVQNELNWQPSQPKTVTSPSQFDALEYSQRKLLSVGVEPLIVESWGFVMLASKIDVPNREIYLDAQKIIASQIELPETLSTVTEVCELLKADGVIMTAKTLNKRLCEWGLQSLTRDNKNRIQYQLTDKSKGMGKIILNSAGNGKSVSQLKWYATKLMEAIAIQPDLN